MKLMRAAAVLTIGGLLLVYAAPGPAAFAEGAAASDTATCIEENGDFQTQGKVSSFVFTLQNKCEKRLKCTIDADVTTAKGPASGHGTLIVEPKSHGDAAKNSFSMKVKAAGGTAQVSRDCKAF
jgi:hypothetical protein